MLQNLTQNKLSLKKKSIQQYSTFESVTAAKKELKPRDALVGLWECVFPRSTCKKLIIIEGSTINQFPVY